MLYGFVLLAGTLAEEQYGNCCCAEQGQRDPQDEMALITGVGSSGAGAGTSTSTSTSTGACAGACAGIAVVAVAVVVVIGGSGDAEFAVGLAVGILCGQRVAAGGQTRFRLRRRAGREGGGGRRARYARAGAGDVRTAGRDRDAGHRPPFASVRHV